MSVNADSMHAIKGKVCLFMLTACMLSKAKCVCLCRQHTCYQKQSVSVNVDNMHAIRDKVCLLMLTACMLSQAKCVC